MASATSLQRSSAVIFISSTTEDLKAYRSAAEQGVRMAHCVPETHELWPAKDHPPLLECLSHVAAADAVVVIVAHRYGWVPPSPPPGNGLKSITWLECEEAVRLQKEVLAFVDRLLDWVKESEVEEKKASDALRRGRRWLQSALVVAVLAAALIAYLAVDAHWAKQDALKQKRIAVDQALVARQLSIKAEQSETKLALEDAELKALKASGQEKDRLEKQIAQLKNSAAQLRAEAASGGQALSTAAQQIRELQMQVSEYQVEIIALKMEKSALISANPMLDIFSRRFDALDNEFSALKRGQANEQEQFGGAIELLFIIISGGASIRLYTHLSRTGPKKR